MSEQTEPSGVVGPRDGNLCGPTDRDLASLLREPGDHDHKYTRGVVGVWAGSARYPGAGVLASSAAVRAGAGMVRLQAPRRVEDVVLAARPEIVLADGRCQAIVTGPGTDLSDGVRAEEIAQAVRRAAQEGLPAVLDAGALALLPGLLGGEGLVLGPRVVLTPHAGEAAVLLTALNGRRAQGEPWDRARVEDSPVQAARELVRLTGATVVLKGTPTLVACPERGRVWALDSGPGWLATAGSGDVLAGLMGAVLAAAQADVEAGLAEDLSPAACAALAVRIHALAGWEASQSTGGPIAALDLCAALPRVIGRVLRLHQ